MLLILGLVVSIMLCYESHSSDRTSQQEQTEDLSSSEMIVWRHTRQKAQQASRLLIIKRIGGEQRRSLDNRSPPPGLVSISRSSGTLPNPSLVVVNSAIVVLDSMKCLHLHLLHG